MRDKRDERDQRDERDEGEERDERDKRGEPCALQQFQCVAGQILAYLRLTGRRRRRRYRR